jgi:hypothetical protein
VSFTNVPRASASRKKSKSLSWAAIMRAKAGGSRGGLLQLRAMKLKHGLRVAGCSNTISGDCNMRTHQTRFIAHVYFVRLLLVSCCVSVLAACVSSPPDHHVKQDEVHWEGQWQDGTVSLLKPDGSTNTLHVLRTKLVWLSNGWKCPYEVTAIMGKEGYCVWLGQTSDTMIEFQNEMYVPRAKISTLMLTSSIRILGLDRMRIEDLSKYLSSNPSGLPIYHSLHGKYCRWVDMRHGVHWGFYGTTPGSSAGGDPHVQRVALKGEELELQLDSPGRHFQVDLLINLRSNRVISAIGTGASTNKLFGLFDTH